TFNGTVQNIPSKPERALSLPQREGTEGRQVCTRRRTRNVILARSISVQCHFPRADFTGRAMRVDWAETTRFEAELKRRIE
ncbi:MAG: hypothetical protein AB1813_13400, partial [Verrucomicrobiota bacterium]